MTISLPILPLDVKIVIIIIVDAPSRESRFDKFTSWCSEHNVACDKIELASFDGLGVGLRATQKVQVG